MEVHLIYHSIGDLSSPVFELKMLYMLIQIDRLHVRDLGLICEIIETHHVECVLIVIFLKLENDGATMARCVPHLDPVIERHLEYKDTAAPDFKVKSLFVGRKFLNCVVVDLDQDCSKVEVLIFVRHIHHSFELMKRHIFDHGF